MIELRRVVAGEIIVNDTGVDSFPRCALCARFIYHTGGVETPRSWICCVCFNQHMGGPECDPGLVVTMHRDGPDIPPTLITEPSP